MGSSSNRYAPRLPQQETKSSTKQLAPTDPILGLENLLKTGFAQKGLPSKPTHAPSAALFHVETHQPRTNQHRVGNKGLEQGPNSVSKNHISFRCKKDFFFCPAPCAFRRVAVYWDLLVLLVYHVTNPHTRGNRSAATVDSSCLCTVLRRALYHFSTRSSSAAKNKS